MKNVLLVSDPHVPYHDKRSVTAVEHLMRDEQPNEIVCLGDFLDFDCISSHNLGNLREISGKTIEKDYDCGNEILDRWQKICPKAKIVMIEGNHEYRIERYLDANPQMEGMIEVPLGLNLKQRKIQWVPFWSKGQVYNIGKATFIHGNKLTNFHSKAMAYAYNRNVYYGHTHDVQEYSVETAGDDKTFVGQSMGCLCNYNQKYMRGKPNKWQQAIGMFHFFDDGYFTPNIIRIFNHRFYFNGKVYQG